MARFRLEQSGGDRFPSAECLIGRSAACTIRIQVPDISAEHAALHWNGQDWELRDLGSRNGTMVDGRRLQAGERLVLYLGARVCFGVRSEAWVLEDDGPPPLMALDPASDEARLGASDLLELPDDSGGEILIYQMPDQGWIMERGETLTPIENGVAVEANGKQWRIHLPGPALSTVDSAPLSVDSAHFRFEVSRDEERVQLKIIAPQRVVELRARAHLYVLLTLARLRARDASNPSLPTSAHGWIDLDALSDILQTDRNNINVSIYRCRHQLAEAGVQGAARIVERRQAGQIRFGAVDAEIVRT